MPLECSNLLDYTPEQLSLLVESIDLNLNAVRDQITRREYIILQAEDMSETLERELRIEIRKLWTKVEDLYGVRAAVVTNHQYVLRAAKAELQ